MKRIKVGLNGFGRIGRAFTRIAFERNSFDIVAINTRKTKAEIMAYLLTYDSVYRRFSKEVKTEGENLIVNEIKIPTLNNPDIESIPWSQYQVDVVIDATGAFRKMEDLKKHLQGTVKKVILSAPSKDDEMPHIVLGANESNFDFAGCSIVSNASCTTNSAAPLFRVLDENFKVLTGFLTTSHGYTSSQSLLDDAAKTKTRSRAAAINIVPTTTGAAKAVAKTLPHLQGKIDGMALRNPLPTGSITDISAVVEKSTTAEEVNNVVKKASESYLKGILEYVTDPIVSSDVIGSPYSCVFDSNYTKVLNGHLIKVFAWYDNEWGYSARLVDLVEKFSDYV